ncbi:hypothetical protein LC653_12590 [Nostoc sp. CHAB 5784]|uniref:hypothetical protein n=1 Tax=Nostoc mirabile TaxID=2907820 RepID=UPI001E5880A0|nr:hypothetical protein [Nostoc mirabile]MCC5664734.1 hypothetical protein [Nostoc mirabile CHAB5784]
MPVSKALKWGMGNGEWGIGDKGKDLLQVLTSCLLVAIFDLVGVQKRRLFIRQS